MFTDISVENAASIFKVKELAERGQNSMDTENGQQGHAP
jgi:hypothetical protein